MIDLLIMGVTFTFEQYLGFALLFLFYGTSLAKYILEHRARVSEPDEKFVKV